MKKAWYHKEWLIFLIGWVLIYAYDPLYMYYAKVASNFEFIPHKILHMWTYSTAFLVLFLIHHYLLIPFFVKKKKTGKYISSVAICLVLFVTFLVVNRSDPEERPNGPRHELRQKAPLLAPPDLARAVMALMMMGVDLGAMAWMNDQKLRERLLILEKQNIQQELEHLHYQINPHFFMNTLNNIHALVDIDQERAKRSIVELSGLMRYALYEGNDNYVELNHEIEFLRLYISLMKLRFNDKVEIVCNMPKSAPTDVKMPPLLLATFVENAFKHGISYLSPSYIHINLSIDDVNKTINFQCVNSLHHNQNTTNDGQHGIGLENVRKRLDLQYSGKYSLIIEERDQNKFLVELSLPQATNPIS